MTGLVSTRFQFLPYMPVGIEMLHRSFYDVAPNAVASNLKEYSCSIHARLKSRRHRRKTMSGQKEAQCATEL
jgi:hypothetical protein